MSGLAPKIVALGFIIMWLLFIGRCGAGCCACEHGDEAGQPHSTPAHCACLCNTPAMPPLDRCVVATLPCIAEPPIVDNEQPATDGFAYEILDPPKASLT